MASLKRSYRRSKSLSVSKLIETREKSQFEDKHQLKNNEKRFVKLKNQPIQGVQQIFTRSSSSSSTRILDCTKTETQSENVRIDSNDKKKSERHCQHITLHKSCTPNSIQKQHPKKARIITHKRKSKDTTTHTAGNVIDVQDNCSSICSISDATDVPEPKYVQPQIS